MPIRKIEVELIERVETGPVQFNDDWPGIFIRGDNAAYYAYALETVIFNKVNGTDEAFTLTTVNSLIRLLRESRV